MKDPKSFDNGARILTFQENPIKDDEFFVRARMRRAETHRWVGSHGFLWKRGARVSLRLTFNMFECLLVSRLEVKGLWASEGFSGS